MFLQKLYLQNFRNYKEVLFDIQGVDSVFLIGENGQGKTNFLESLYYVSYGKSFKAKKEDHVILHGENSFTITGVFEEEAIEKEIAIHYTNGKKTILHNKTPIKNRREMLNNFPSLVFKHSDIFFVSGSPEYQRLFLDQMLVLNHNEYLQAFQQYKKVLLQKNMALKKGLYDLISVYNEQLIDNALIIIRYRKQAIIYINNNLEKMFSFVFGEPVQLQMKYSSHWNYTIENANLDEIKQQLLDKTNSAFEQEKKQKTSVIGIHRDIIKIFFFDHDFKTVASTGQIRIISLLLRSIQANYYYLHHNKSMIYLFDDVLLEIDVEKQKRFLQYLPDAKQTFFTFLPEEDLPYILVSKSKKFFNIQNGIIKEA